MWSKQEVQPALSVLVYSHSFSMAMRQVYLLVVIACSVLTNLLVQASQSCEITFKVDSRVEDSDWKTLYKDYQVTKSDHSLLNLTTSDLQEALQALNTTVFHRAGNCVELIISQGHYSVSQSVYMRQNVRIIGEVPGEVWIEFSNLTAPENVDSYNSITIYGSSNVIISGINFSSSPGLIYIERVTRVQVTSCSFQLFSRGALDIYQCFFVQVHNCFFEQNGGERVTKFGYQYRGHAGGLSIGFDDNHYNDSGTNPATLPEEYGIFVSRCTFQNNTSRPRALVSTAELFQRFVFAGRGGGSAITINSTSISFNVTVANCIFEDNTATSLSGGLYIVFSGFNTHMATVDGVVIARNRCPGAAGGMLIGFIGAVDDRSAGSLQILNSEFYDNQARLGGGIYMFTNLSRDVFSGLQLASIKNCTFKRNSASEFGAAVCLNSLLFLVETSSLSLVTIMDCTFEGNSGGRAGVLSIAYLPISFIGTNIFSNNTGQVLVLSGNRAEIRGKMTFFANNPSGLESGALHITSFGQLKLFSGAEILFVNNSGILGASMVVDSSASFGVSGFSQVLFNPLCVLQSENTTDSPLEWQNISITFSGNLAYLGSAVFMNNIQFCTWVDRGPHFFDRQQVLHWSFINFTEDNVNTAHYPQEANPLWYVQTPAESLIPETSNVSVYPGEMFAVKVIGVDEYGQPVTVSVRLTDDTGNYEFSPSASSPLDIQSPNIVTKVAIANISDFSPRNISITSIVTDIPITVPFTLTTLPCPAGYVLRERSPSQVSCECSDENKHITNCDGEIVQLADGLWGVENPESEDKLTTYPCPQHYCQCLRADNVTGLTCQYLFNPKQPDDQCFCKRKGILCGSCADENAGFSALLNNCKSCEATGILYVIALMVLDTLVIGGLLLFLKTSVYSWFYPTLFYIQIAPYVTFLFPMTFEVVHPYVYYVSSALSFYFVYDFCLAPRLSAIVVYFVRFIPILITVAVAVPIFIVRHFQKKTNKEAWPGLWLVVLLQYTHVIHTCMSVLNCPMLPGYDGVIKPHWYVNGNIECFTGGHIPLALLSIALLGIFVIAIPLTLMFTISRRKKRGWLYNILLPSSDAYKKKYSWWGVLELLRRVIILLFAVALPAMEYWVIFFLSMIVGVYLFVQPYKGQLANIIEAFLATNILILLLLRSIDGDITESSQRFFSLGDYSSEGCVDSAVHVFSISSAILTPGYYIPLVVFLLVTTLSLVFKVRSHIRRKKVKQEFKEDEYDILSSFNGRYHMLRDGRDTEFITNTVITTDDDQIPLSKILGDLNNKKRDDPKQGNRFGHSMEPTALYKVQTQQKYALRRRSST